MALYVDCPKIGGIILWGKLSVIFVSSEVAILATLA
jgi:hypothetical protein